VFRREKPRGAKIFRLKTGWQIWRHLMYYVFVKTLTIAEAARSFSDVLDELERDQEEIALVRGDQAIARIIPEPARANALVVLGDLYATLDADTGKALQNAVKKGRARKNQKLGALRNPWAS
jgi:hypothetical protein